MSASKVQMLLEKAGEIEEQDSATRSKKLELYARRIKSLGASALAELEEAKKNPNQNIQECAEIAIMFINAEILLDFSSARSKESLEMLISAYQMLQQHEEQDEIKPVMDDFRRNAPSHLAMLLDVPDMAAEVKELLTLIGIEETQDEAVGKEVNPRKLPEGANEEIASLIRSMRMVSAGEGRRNVVRRLGLLLGDEHLNEIADRLRIISVGEIDFLPFERLQREDAELWAILSQALDANGIAPAVTLKEALGGIGKLSPEQIVRWFGADAALYISEQIGSRNHMVMGTPSILIKYAEILGNIGDTHSINALEIMLEISNEGVRRDAIKALGKIASPEALQVLLRHSKAEQGNVTSKELASALANFDDPHCIPALKTLFEHGYTDTRKNAGVGLIRLGLIDDVVEVMNSHSDKMFQSSAANALGEAEDTSATRPHLLHALEHHTYFMVRLPAIRRLGELQDEAAFDLFMQILPGNSYTQKKAVVEALLHYGNRGVDALGGCVDDVSMPDWAVKQNQPTVSQKAKEVLERIGTPEALEMVSRWN